MQQNFRVCQNQCRRCGDLVRNTGAAGPVRPSVRGAGQRSPTTTDERKLLRVTSVECVRRKTFICKQGTEEKKCNPAEV